MMAGDDIMTDGRLRTLFDDAQSSYEVPEAPLTEEGEPMPADKKYVCELCHEPKEKDEMFSCRWGVTKKCKRCVFSSRRTKAKAPRAKEPKTASARRSFTLTCPKCGHEIAGLK